MHRLDHTRRIVQDVLAEFLDAKLAEARAASTSLEPVCEAVRDLTMRGGKRLRPCVAMAGYLTAGGREVDRAARAVAALELLQTYLLIHDDWMDGDELRRGGPTVHVSLGRAFGAHLGAAAAILAGDLASSYARQLLVAAPLPAEALVAALREYAAFEAEVVEGQQLDLLGAGAAIGIEELYDRKTGSYTVRGPLRLGAVLAGAGAELLAKLDAVSRPVGRAFQIRDDLIGLFGDPEVTGKAVGGDLRAAKRTWIVEAALTLGSPEQQGPLRRVLGDPESTAVDVEEAIEAIRASGALAGAEARVEELRAEAQAALEALPVGEGRAVLTELVDRLCRRDA